MNKGASRRFCSKDDSEKSFLEKAKKLYDLEYSIDDIAEKLNITPRDARWLYSLVGCNLVRF